MFKSGDKVKVKSSIEVKRYEFNGHGIQFTDAMKKWLGKTITITKQNYNGFWESNDTMTPGCSYVWADDWLEPIPAEVPKHQYKPGDKVRIKSDITPDISHAFGNGESLYFNPEMKRFYGKVVTLKSKIDDFRWRIDEASYQWIEDWFEPSEASKPAEAVPPTFKKGDTVRIKPLPEKGTSHCSITPSMRLHVGDTGTVISIACDGDVGVHLPERDWFFDPSWLESVSESSTLSKPTPAKAKRLTVGDRVKLIDNPIDAPLTTCDIARRGTIGEIVHDDHGEAPYLVNFDGIRKWCKEDWVIPADSESIEPDTKEDSEDEDEIYPEFHVGDFVMPVSDLKDKSDFDTSACLFDYMLDLAEESAVGKVIKVDDDQTVRVHFKSEEADDTDWWDVRWLQPWKLNVGDYARVKPDLRDGDCYIVNMHDFVGKVFKVTHVPAIELDGATSPKGAIWTWNIDQLLPASESEYLAQQRSEVPATTPAQPEAWVPQPGHYVRVKFLLTDCDTGMSNTNQYVGKVFQVAHAGDRNGNGISLNTHDGHSWSWKSAWLLPATESEYLAQTKPEQPKEWIPQPGEYVRVKPDLTYKDCGIACIAHLVDRVFKVKHIGMFVSLDGDATGWSWKASQLLPASESEYLQQQATEDRLHTSAGISSDKKEGGVSMSSYREDYPEVSLSYNGKLVISGKSFVDGSMTKVDDEQIVKVNGLTDIVGVTTPIEDIAVGDTVKYNGYYYAITEKTEAGFKGIKYVDGHIDEFAVKKTAGFPSLLNKITYVGNRFTVPQMLSLGSYMGGTIGEGICLALGQQLVAETLAAVKPAPAAKTTSTKPAPKVSE